jgi:hypothetical protein
MDRPMLTMLVVDDDPHLIIGAPRQVIDEARAT